MENVTSPERVVFLGILFVLACVAIGLWLYFGLRGAPVDDTSTSELMRQAAHNALHWRPIHMSSGNDGDAKSVPDPVYIPVSHTSIEENDIPDIDAKSAFDRDITDGEWIVRMACARGPDKKYRFSANAIYSAVGGDRNAVLAKIREIRATPEPPKFIQEDGTLAPASYPVTGRRSAA